MKLHENKGLFKQAIRYTADQLGIPDIYIEKDYWVTFALLKIFKNPIGKDVVFKGGTSLSKCFSLIDRFSEDIDLVVIRRLGESDNRMKKKLKQIGLTVEPELLEVEIEGVTRKRGMNRKTAHSYQKEFKGKYGQVRDVIVLETSWLGYYEPYEQRTINSFIGQMMLDNEQTDQAEEMQMMPFEVAVLSPQRTICEKIMSLVRFSNTNQPIIDLKNKIRHIYDLNQLLKEPELASFLRSPAFDKMLVKVGEDDVKSFRNNKEWLAIHPKEAVLFKETDKTWNQIKSVYQQDFKNLVYGILPDEEEVFATLKYISERLQSIEWDVNINEEL